MPRVLVWIQDMTFSFDNRMLKEVHALREAGYEMTVLSPREGSDPWFAVRRGVACYFYPKFHARSTLCHLLEHALDLIVVFFYTLWIALRRKFDIFHACNPIDIGWIIAAPYKLLGRKKFVFDQHDLVPELVLSRGSGADGLLYRLMRALESASYRFADAVIVPNRSYRRVAVERGRVPADRVHVVRNAPDLEKFVERPGSRTFDPPVTTVGYVGNMNPQDGVDHLLEAARILIDERERRDIGFVLVGGGTMQPVYAAETARGPLADRIHFTGRVSDEEMLDRLNGCDICVQPDPPTPLNDVSTMNKALEYMALGKPVVTYDLQETRVSCGEAARYAHPSRPRALAEEIRVLADDPGLRQRLAERGRRRVRDHLQWDKVKEPLLEAYSGLTPNPPTPRVVPA